ncbi:MAG TPA: ABC transporter ATP-binding protein [Ignavibacteriaceae bacterium]|nr:ABC transporter ATP-binding protein [Ignavibacteriaceae bacterium]
MNNPFGSLSPVIDVKEVYKSFRKGKEKTVEAVKGVSLVIKKGQFAALLGPNGAGKTTLVEMIEGIQKPDRGEIYITGKNWKGNEDELHKLIGLSLQETYFIDKLNVEETLKLFASFYELDRKRVDEVIDLVGLEEKRKSYTVNLSGGQRQKLAIGIALLNTPKILLLDEPTTGLDPNARREIWSILLNLKEGSDTSLILTTHYMEEAEQLCDYIIIIHKGEILKEGTTMQLLDEEHAEKRAEFTLHDQKHSDNLFAGSKFNVEWDKSKEKYTVSFKNLEAELPELFGFIKSKGLRIKNFESRRKTLDDLFISLTGRHLDEENNEN